jgi:transposase
MRAVAESRFRDCRHRVRWNWLVAKGYRPVIRDQGFLLPPDMRDWLPEGHPVWVVIEAVRLLDTSAFHARRKTGGAGAAGYDPDMLVTLLIWAYANQVASSRRIERLCGQDLAFRVICGGSLPGHATVARFRRQFAGAVPALFAEVLMLCARLGMGRVGVVALDGTKIAANASRAANRAEDGLARMAGEMGAAHAAADAEDDALFGKDGRGDDDPGDPSTRAERVAAALASARRENERRGAGERARADEHVRAARAGEPVRGRPAAGTGAELARQQVARETAAQQARCDAYAAATAAGKRPAHRAPAPPAQFRKVRAAQARLDKALAAQAARQAAGQDGQPVRRNVTDPASRLMPVRGGGFIQGYNAQNVTSSDGLIIATRLVQETTGTRWYQPMTSGAIAAAAAMAAARGGQDEKIGLVLADAGYLSNANLACPGPDRLIATGKYRDLGKAARGHHASGGNEEEASAIAAMAARLAAPDGITAYRQRGHIAETPHGNIKHNLRFRQLSMRGLRNASAEWQFACTVHNLLTAITSGHLTRQALQGLAT